MNKNELELSHKKVLNIYDKNYIEAVTELFKNKIDKENIKFKNIADAINIILFLNQHNMWKKFVPMLLVKNGDGLQKNKISFGNIFNNFSKYKLSPDLAAHYKSGNLNEVDLVAALFNISFLTLKVIEENSFDIKNLKETFFSIENTKSHEIITELSNNNFNNKSNQIFESIR